MERLDTAPRKVTTKRTAQPNLLTMEKWLYNGIAMATDGCQVECDGTCPHGAQSWIMELGYI